MRKQEKKGLGNGKEKRDHSRFDNEIVFSVDPGDARFAVKLCSTIPECYRKLVLGLWHCTIVN